MCTLSFFLDGNLFHEANEKGPASTKFCMWPHVHFKLRYNFLLSQKSFDNPARSNCAENVRETQHEHEEECYLNKSKRILSKVLLNIKS
jgi:hypothetical protein